jgi:hypothetical protein
MAGGVLTSVAVAEGLDDHQFEMDGYRWGLHCPISTDAQGFNPGNNGWLTQDQNSTLTGANMMGRDVRQAQTWSWILHVDQDSPETALAELAAMGSRWMGGVVGFRNARDVKMLRYCVAGRTRVIFGRPRNFDYAPDNRLLSGYMPPSATFQKADALHYDDVEQSADLTLGAVKPGGFEWPASFPITFTRDADYVPPWAVVVGGDAPTAPVIEFTGPVLNPAIQVGAYKLALSGLLPEGAKIRIDARPWANTIRRSGAASPNLQLSSQSRLSSMRLLPGAYDAVFTGVDATGSARCRILWRDAWHTL